MVARLRETAENAEASPDLRAWAVQRLAALAAEVDDEGVPLVPHADPDRWWGLATVTEGAESVRDPSAPIALSGSGLDALLDCPLQWFLDHEVGAAEPRASATRFGSVIHAVAEHVAKGTVPAELDAMDAVVDHVWRELRFDAGWQSVTERAEARAALSRFLRYHLARARSLVGTERYVQAVVDVPVDAGQEQVALRGYIDRVEADEAGRLVPVDLKTSRRPPGPKEIPEYSQLGVYQLLLREEGAEVGGAALLQLRISDSKAPSDAKEQFQPSLPDAPDTWIEIKLGEAAATVRAETFVARPGQPCRNCSFAASCPTKAQGGQVIA
jgi:RecB family exonuclease